MSAVPRKRPNRGHLGTSVSGQELPRAVQQSEFNFDLFLGVTLSSD
jgi:hypothetical protein